MEDVANSLVRGVTDICVSKFQILSALIFSGYNCLKEKKKEKNYYFLCLHPFLVTLYSIFVSSAIRFVLSLYVTAA